MMCIILTSVPVILPTEWKSVQPVQFYFYQKCLRQGKKDYSFRCRSLYVDPSSLAVHKYLSKYNLTKLLRKLPVPTLLQSTLKISTSWPSRILRVFSRGNGRERK